MVIFDSGAPPLPDTGQWLLLALNEKLPHVVIQILRARIIGLHHYLMLFIMLAFSVLFNSVKAPGLGLGARYMFTMAIGRLLRTISFVSTILPSTRHWCAGIRFKIPSYPHRWAQRYYIPYTSDSNALYHLISRNIAYGKSHRLGSLSPAINMPYAICLISKCVFSPKVILFCIMINESCVPLVSFLSGSRFIKSF